MVVESGFKEGDDGSSPSEACTNSPQHDRQVTVGRMRFVGFQGFISGRDEIDRLTGAPKRGS